MEFEEVNYWDEIMEIFDWVCIYVIFIFYICWVVQVGLYYYYGIFKYVLDKKMFGIFKYCMLFLLYFIFCGFDDEFYVFYSWYMEV